MKLTDRQQEILALVKEQEPMTGDDIANKLSLSRATIRPDLTILTMLGFLGARPKVGYYYEGDTSDFKYMSQVQNVRVRDYMSMPVVLEEDSSIYDGVVTIFLENIGTIFVTSNGDLVGCVSRKDLLRATIGKLALEVTPLSLIMTRMPNIICISPDDTIYEAAKKINAHHVDALPVIEKQGDKNKVIGRITKTNITRVFVELGGLYE
ncbi:helix-turn-helix transcriptional regulator [Peptoniphilus sp. KCTC 25270]|uniref:helix-turn-helix transcriptional regulator n=1 Tax=Peptoniphilus sp. KCTC 25270 TaxID=2897414 RepID=UPI001E3ADDFC|nr:helix-turn-helix transcriptional regulator [Peptoniphilus sp. KCTC 25270]MCD1146870.1 helix-turn-helix transcriptional regulator [Peptoniphilus sp. KCTC 25270]